MEILEKTVLALLKKNRLFVDPDRFGKELNSHPDYPALNAVTDTLQLFGIESAVVHVSSDDLEKNGVPALVHLPARRNPLVLLEEVDCNRVVVYDYHTRERLVYTPRTFRSVWNGIALYTAAAEEPDGLISFGKNILFFGKKEDRLPAGEIEKNLASVRGLFSFFRTKYGAGCRWLAVVLLLSAGLFLFYRQTRPLDAVYYAWLALKGLGLAVCIALVRHELDLSGAALDKLCSLAPSFSCSAVLHSKAAKLFEAIRLADLGMVYFAGGILLLMQAAWNPDASGFIPILACLALLSVAYVFFSLLYQQLVVKKWCPLCLSVLLVLLAEAGIAASLFRSSAYQLSSLTSWLWCGWVFLAVAGAWYGLYRLVESRVRLGKKETDYLRLIKNRRVRQALLQTDPAVDTGSLPLQTGAASAAEVPVTVTAVLSLFCAPCGQVCRSLLELPRDLAAVDFCLIPPTDRETDSSYQLTGYFYGIYLERGETVFRRALSMWLYRTDAALLRRRFPLLPEAVSEGLAWAKKQKAWTVRQQVVATPAVWIGRKKLPDFVQADDMLYFVQGAASDMPAS